jgi:cysteine-rich repeat protein
MRTILRLWTILVACGGLLAGCGSDEPVSTPVCGDGERAVAEFCDDGNLAAGDGCSELCGVEEGWTCEGSPSTCIAICGDGRIVGAEACDDGGTTPDDGCSAACAVETGWACTGEPSVCAETCGDGDLDAGEGCDDGATADGDGCTGSCGVEDGWDCSGEPSVCNTICGDGLVAGAEECDDAGTATGDGCDPACAVEEGWTCTGVPSACSETCGDGLLVGDEECDDAGVEPGDGCDGGCAVEAGWSCTGTPSVCAPVCGDGRLAGEESCDDGGSVAGDGCSDSCGEEEGWSCSGEPSACTPICGDGLPFGDEECDDGGVAPGDGCSANCRVEEGWNCDGTPAVCSPICGDGLVLGAETCDDGDGEAGDGCDASCAVELGWNCSGAPSACVTTCGDGMVAGLEGCDDAGTAPGDGCSDTCTVERGYGCAGAPSICATVCGDGIVAGAEACDDAGVADGDGCSAACATELGFVCTGEPSVCTTTCGDGIVAGAEACDDGGTAPDDGCSATCTAETGYTCTGSPSVCTATCGDGLVVDGEGCDDGGTTSRDGCSALCAIERGFTCSGAPSVCVAVCGDGIVATTEGCDDGDTTPLDGCSDSCTVETGFYCGGEPSVCLTTCGDGVRASTEPCDDGNDNTGDGCDYCAVEAGWDCSGATCTPICGDGIAVGTEECDDGNTASDDGCLASCQFPSGESCAEPLTALSATQDGGALRWDFASGAATAGDGAFVCDDSGIGPDVVIRVDKASPTLAQGGMLLHVKALTNTTGTANYLDLEITSGACGGPAAVSEKCLWNKAEWDAYLDVPAGPYWIFVAKTSSGTFPSVTVWAEEVPASAAEGEGCFAPYTTSTASSIYTAAATPDGPHTWLMPGTINSFDMGKTWGEPHSISCDDHATYGDITGVDGVIQFQKAAADSVLLVQVTNLANPLSGSDLDVEVVNVCDTSSPGKVSLACGANADTHEFVVGGSQGPYYVWVTTEATSEDFGGARVEISEISIGPGESRWSPEVITVSTSTPPTSSRRLEAPSCFPAAPTAVHWYKYTMTTNAVGVRTLGGGALALFDSAGRELSCVANGAAGVYGYLGDIGEDVVIAVSVEPGVTGLGVIPVDYKGIKGVHTPLEVSFPSSATSDYALAVGPSDLYLNSGSKVFVFPKTGGTAVERGTADGLTSSHLGYDMIWAGGGLFSVDTTANVSTSRVFKIFDGTTWGPITWDLNPAYPASTDFSGLATDGSALFVVPNTLNGTELFTLPLAAPGTAVSLGLNTSLEYAVGLAVDANYFYLAARTASDDVEGIYRVPRASPTDPPTLLAALDTSALTNKLFVDNPANPQFLYVREYGGRIYAIHDPDGSTPIRFGPISQYHSTNDYGMGYDATDNSLYIFESVSLSSGKIWKIQ